MDWKKQENQALIEAILALRSADESQRFLRDLLTPAEIVEFAKRLETARLLTEKVPYTVIEKKTGLSSTTVARVSKWLKSKGGGYRTIIGRMHHHPVALARGD